MLELEITCRSSALVSARLDADGLKIGLSDWRDTDSLAVALTRTDGATLPGTITTHAAQTPCRPETDGEAFYPLQSMAQYPYVYTWDGQPYRRKNAPPDDGIYADYMSDGQQSMSISEQTDACPDSAASITCPVDAHDCPHKGCRNGCLQETGGHDDPSIDRAVEQAPVTPAAPMPPELAHDLAQKPAKNDRTSECMGLLKDKADEAGIVTYAQICAVQDEMRIGTPKGIRWHIDKLVADGRVEIMPDAKGRMSGLFIKSALAGSPTARNPKCTACLQDFVPTSTGNKLCVKCRRKS